MFRPCVLAGILTLACGGADDQSVFDQHLPAAAGSGGLSEAGAGGSDGGSSSSGGSIATAGSMELTSGAAGAAAGGAVSSSGAAGMSGGGAMSGSAGAAQGGSGAAGMSGAGGKAQGGAGGASSDSNLGDPHPACPGYFAVPLAAGSCHIIAHTVNMMSSGSDPCPEASTDHKSDCGTITNVAAAKVLYVKPDPSFDAGGRKGAYVYEYPSGVCCGDVDLDSDGVCRACSSSGICKLGPVRKSCWAPPDSSVGSWYTNVGPGALKAN